MPDLEPIAVHEDQMRLIEPPRLYRTPEVCEVADVTYRQLDYWIRTGLVTPTREAHGSGTQREFSEADIVVVRAVKLLRPLLHGQRVSRRRFIRPDLLEILNRIRHGQRGMVQIEEGVWYDLDVLLG